MGAEFLIDLKPNDKKRVKAWYDKLPEEPNPFSIVLSPETNKNKVTSWIWVDFESHWGKNVVELGYSFGGQGCNGEVAIAIGAELLKRVKAKRWGWDSVGWCSKQEMQRGVPRPFGSEIRRRRDYAEEHPIEAAAFAKFVGSVELLEKSQAQLEEWAAKLFKETWK